MGWVFPIVASKLPNADEITECDFQSKFSISLKTILDKQDGVVSIDVDVFDFAQAQLVSFLF